MSKAKLINTFKNFMGISPLNYLFKVRTEKLKEKIENGVTDIVQIANECGFFDSSHLDNHFTK